MSVIRFVSNRRMYREIQGFLFRIRGNGHAAAIYFLRSKKSINDVRLAVSSISPASLRCDVDAIYQHSTRIQGKKKQGKY